MIPLDRLYTLASNILNAVEAHYLASVVELPARRYVTAGLPAWDCEQVTVQAVSMAAVPDPLVPAGAVYVGAERRTVQFAVEVVRCYPTDEDGNPPAITEEEDVSALVLADVAHIDRAVRLAMDDGLLPGCAQVTFTSWTGLGPQGGLVGGRTVLTIYIE